MGKPVILLGLMLLMLTLRADYNGINTNGWTGAQINPQATWRPFLTPDQAAAVGSDVEAGQYDTFNQTRQNPNGVGGLAIDLPHVCEGADIAFTVTSNGAPMAGANVGLFSHSGGRNLIGEVTTDANGHAIFARQSIGGYDLVATVPNYTLAQKIFRIDWCMSGPDAYAQATKSGAGVAGQAPDGTAIRSATVVSTQQIEYPSGLVRTFDPIMLPDGRLATLITLSANLSADLVNATLVEVVSSSLANGPQAIGFQSDYPDNISSNGPVQLQWKLPTMKAGHQVMRSYVLLRPMYASMAGQYGMPIIFDSTGQAWNPAGATMNGSAAGAGSMSGAGLVGGAASGSGAAGEENGNAAPSPRASSVTATSAPGTIQLGGADIPVWWILSGIGLVVALAVFWKALSKRRKR